MNIQGWLVLLEKDERESGRLLVAEVILSGFPPSQIIELPRPMNWRYPIS
jgi:hypothetical protein